MTATPRTGRAAGHGPGHRARVAQGVTGRLLLLVVLILAMGPARAEVQHRIGFDDARIESRDDMAAGLSRLFEDGRSQAIRREGGGLAPVIAADPVSGSAVLALATGPTPEGARADRVELTVAPGLAFGQDWAAGFSLYLPDQRLPEGNWTLILQCHQDGTGRSPPLSLNLDPDGSLVLVGRGEADSYRRLWSGPLPRGRWVEIDLGFRLGPGGAVRLALDGQVVAAGPMTLTWAAGQESCTLKTGIYRGPADMPLALRLDDVTLAAGALPF